MEFTPGARSVKITYRGGQPCRIQIPRMLVVNENPTYGTLELVACPEFVAFWTRLEDACKKYADNPWNSLLNDGRFKIKIDERSHVFDSDLKLKVGGADTYTNEYVTCILEVRSIYKFKGMCGITCRVHQMKIHKKVCAL